MLSAVIASWRTVQYLVTPLFTAWHINEVIPRTYAHGFEAQPKSL